MENNSPSSNAGQSLGIIALIFGIIGLLAAFIPCFGFIAVIFGVLAIVFGAIALNQAKKDNASTSLPKAGLYLGIAATIFVIIWVAIFVGSVGSMALEHKDEIKRALDSIKVEKIQTDDSLNVKVQVDSTTIETTIK
jgi:membrane-bound ClpP family serine protease